MTELVEFLRARYDEREQKAKAAAGDYPNWMATDDGTVCQVDTGGSGYLATGPWDSDLFEVGEHIADNDPAYVLADLDAKRCILDAYHNYRTDPNPYPPEWQLGKVDALELAVRALALPFAGHPDYRSEWAVAK